MGREAEMVVLTQIARQTSAKLRQMLSNNPLVHPLGGAADSAINRALAMREFRRADLFTRGKTLAPHRHRIAAMLAAYHFSPKQITADHWPELKHADHRCAYCIDKKRCERWLRESHIYDSPRRFCPNAMTFEQWRRDYLQLETVEDKMDGGSILENGFVQTRESLRRLRRQSPPEPIVSPPSTAGHGEAITQCDLVGDIGVEVKNGTSICGVYTMTTVERILENKGREVWTIDPDDSVLHALEEMANKNVGALVAMENEMPVGIFTERNYARNIFLKGRSSPTTPVRDVMRTDVIYVRPDQTVEQCMAIMTEKRVRHLPVLHEGKMTGIVSIGDLVKSTIDQQKFTIEQLVNYISGTS
jgi:CBS domain-containing protein